MPARVSWDQRLQRCLHRIAIDPETGCWLWLGTRDPQGYGIFVHRIGPWRQGEDKTFRTHRFMYEHCRGKVPQGLVLHHSCEVRHCCYPDHLVPLTRGEHMAAHGYVGARKSTARAASQTHCKRGHEYTLENTHIDKHGKRWCRACGRLRANKLWAEGRYSRQKR